MKKLHLRTLKNGKISVGEYIRVKWHNVCEPFDLNDKVALGKLHARINAYAASAKRGVEFVSKEFGLVAKFTEALSNL